MINKLTMYPPVRGIIHEFVTTEELLRISDVKEFTQHFYGNFHRFSVSKPQHIPNAPELILMVEYDGGKRWGVIGYIERAEGVNLPEWEMPKR